MPPEETTADGREQKGIVPDFQITPSLEQLWAAVRALEDSFRFHLHTGYDLTRKLTAKSIQNVPRVYSSNYTAVSSTGNNLQTLRSFTLQGKDLGLNGMLELVAYFTSTNVDANRPQLDIGGTAVATLARVRTDGILIWRIVARNSETSQITYGFERAIPSEDAATVMAATASTVDLAANQTIAIRCQPDTTDVLTLQSYTAILYPTVT